MRIHETPEQVHCHIAEDINNEQQLLADMSEIIASRMARILKQRRMSQKEFARRVGHSQGEVSRWLSGRHNFTLATLAHISVTLGENILEL